MKLLYLAFMCVFIGTVAQPTCNGQAYNSALYTCTVNDQGKQVLCPSGLSSCGNACYNPSQYCCQSGQLKQSGQCTTGTSQPPTSQQTSSPQTSLTMPPATSSQPGTCNGQAYDRTQYDCPTNEAGRQVLCPKGNSACGTACYLASQYCCQAGQLRQAGQCTGQTTSTQTTSTQSTATTATTAPPSSSQSQPGTCNGQAYDRNLYDCPTNDAGQRVLCPKGNSACGTACYNPSQYCCQSGQLRQAGQCTPNPGSQTCTSGETYNPATSFCCSAIADAKTKVCPIGQHCCGNLLNGTSYFGSGSVYVGCYDPTQFKCCYGGTSNYFNPSKIEPISYQIPPNTIRFCQA